MPQCTPNCQKHRKMSVKDWRKLRCKLMITSKMGFTVLVRQNWVRKMKRMKIRKSIENPLFSQHKSTYFIQGCDTKRSRCYSRSNTAQNKTKMMTKTITKDTFNTKLELWRSLFLMPKCVFRMILLWTLRDLPAESCYAHKWYNSCVTFWPLAYLSNVWIFAPKKNI